MIGQALTQVRDLSNLLRPGALDDLGLVAALKRLAADFQKSTRIETRFDVESSPEQLKSDLEVVPFRIVQEALTNEARHADAGSVVVTLEGRNGEVRWAVSDDGQCVALQPTPNLCLLGIRDRVTWMGGSLTIGTAPVQGFHLVARIPTGAGAQSPPRRGETKR